MKISKIISGMVVGIIITSSTLSVAAEADNQQVETKQINLTVDEAKVDQQSKNLHDEIARRMTIISLAEGSSDKVLIAEADMARAELIGYQRQRADRMGQSGIVEADNLANSPTVVEVAQIQQADTSSESEDKSRASQWKATAKKHNQDIALYGLSIVFSFLTGFFFRGILSN